MKKPGKSRVADQIGRADAVASMGTRIYEFVKALPSFYMAYLAGGGMSFLAWISDWIKAWGPVGVGGVGLGSALIAAISISIVRYVAAKKDIESTKKRLVEIALMQPRSINPLADSFEKAVIEVSSLLLPQSKLVEHKIFRNCHIKGPGVLCFGSRISINSFTQYSCDNIVIDFGDMIYTGIVLQDCNFIDCVFYDITFIITPDIAAYFKSRPLTGEINLAGVKVEK